MFICKNCSGEISPKDTACSSCGTSIIGGYDVKCSKCGAVNTGGNRFCAECGGGLDSIPQTKCSACGSLSLPGAKFCIKCGGAVHVIDEEGRIRDLAEKENALKQKEVELEARAARIDERAAKRAKDVAAYREELVKLPNENLQKLKTLSQKLKNIAQFAADPIIGETDEEIAKNNYTCAVCGVVNNQCNAKCRSCGRDRYKTAALVTSGKITPKEEVKQLKKYTPSQIIVEKVIESPPFVIVNQEPSSVSQKEESESKQTVQKQAKRPMYGGYQYGGGIDQNGDYYEAPPLVQPVVFVPYISQEQPLLQYTDQPGEAMVPAVRED